MKPPGIDTLTELVADAMHRDDWTTSEQLRPRLEQAEDARPAPQLASSALWYAEQGHPVFPLSPGSKKPWPGSKGLHDATTDIATIRAWWAKSPRANIGLATGHRFDVIDIDGPVGVRSRLDNWDAFSMPFLGMVSTPRPGGLHLYVPASGRGNKAGLLPGIDYRGVGGYVVAPPSCVTVRADPDTKHDGGYHWLAPLGEQRGSCRLHGDHARPDACWACGELAKVREEA